MDRGTNVRCWVLGMHGDCFTASEIAGSQWPLGTAAWQAAPKSLSGPAKSAAHSTAWIALETGEREGALLQSILVLEGVWDVRLPYGYQRSRQVSETAESPIPHIQAGQEETVL